MKIKKLLALLLAIVMICGVFAVMPVSAEDVAEPEVEEVVVDDGYLFKAYQVEEHPGWATAPTVDSYNGYFTIDATYAITTKQTYDMNTTSIRLNSVTPPSAPHSIIINISPDNYNTFGVVDDIDAGKMTFILDFDYGTNVRFYSNVAELRENGLDRLIAQADNYEISFSKNPVITYDEYGDILEEVTEYALRINGYTLVTTDEEHWIARFMNAPSFAASNITIATGHLAKFNADISDYRGFATSNERNTGGIESGTSAVVTGSTNDGYSVMSLDGKVASTTQSFDFTEKTLSVRPTWAGSGDKHNYACAMSITFAADRKKVKKSVSDEYNLCLLFGPSDNSYSKNRKSIYINDSTSSTLSPWSATTGETKNKANYFVVQAASYDNDQKAYLYDEEYNISFVNVGDKKWIMVINGTYIEHDAINNFCNNGGLDAAYVSVAGASGIKASAKVIDRKVKDWASDNKNSDSNSLSRYARTSKNADGTDKYLLYAGASHMSVEKVNLFETTIDFTIDISYVSGESSSKYNPSSLKVVFANEYGHAKDKTASDNTLIFDISNTYLSASNIYWFGLDGKKTSDGKSGLVPGWSESWSGVTVRAAGEKLLNFKFNFCKEADGTYSIYINQKKISSTNYEKIADFCENYGDGAFVSLYYTDSAANDKRLKCTPLLNETVSSHKLAIADVDVKGNTLKNVAAKTTVADLKAKASVAKYYAVSVVNAAGEVVADDAVIGSGYKMVVNYNFIKDGTSSVVATDRDIVVLGDANGDAAVNAADLVICKKKLFDTDVEGAYTDALNIAYDDQFDILDYIALADAMLN